MVSHPQMRRRDHERNAHDQERGETGRTGHETLMVIRLDDFQGSVVIVAVMAIRHMNMRRQDHRRVTLRTI